MHGFAQKCGLTCEAGGSIKPGAQAPGSRAQQIFKPANAGDRMNVKKSTNLRSKELPPISWARKFNLILILGLAPQALGFRPFAGLDTTFVQKPDGSLNLR